jgi:hypothetical protein
MIVRIRTNIFQNGSYAIADHDNLYVADKMYHITRCYKHSNKGATHGECG